MVIARRVLRQKRQLLIAVPPEVRKALALKAGGVVYWHTYRQGEALVALNATRRGGKPPTADRGPAIQALEREVDRLRARLASQRASIWNEYRNQEMGRRLHLELKGYPALDAINDRLRAIEDALTGRPDLLRKRAAARRSREKARGASVTLLDASPSPSPSPSVEVSGGAAASGGDAPQAAHNDA